MTNIPEDRIVPWAAARSIFGASVVMNGFHENSPKLMPELLPNGRIAIGQKGLVFKDASLLQAIATGFSMPEFFPMIKNPLSAFETISTLKKIARLYDRDRPGLENLVAIFRAGLESLAVFANHDPSSCELLSDDAEELVVFKLADSEPLGWLRRSSEGFFSVGTGFIDGKPSVVLTFSSQQVAFDAVLHGIDQLGAPAKGEMEIQGKIPLMDKLGYVSRIAQGKVPMPR
jgi:hypothetical protein